MQRGPSFSLDDLYDPADWCAWCGARLPQDAYWGRRRYCSRECSAELRWAKQGKTRADVIAERRCAQCGGPMAEHLHAGSLYCSTRCRQAHHIGLRGEARAEARAGRACEECGASLDHLTRRDARYCSRRCGQRAWERRRRAKKNAP